MADEPRGTKRKRYQPPKEDLSVKIAGKLHHDVKEVRREAKKAKAFETRKLVKKLKEHRRKDDNEKLLKQLELELAELKVLDHDAIANSAFKMKLTKDKILGDNEHVQAAISQELASNILAPAPADTPAAKVQNRLLSSKSLAAGILAAVSDLRAALQPKPNKNDDKMEDIIETVVSERPKKIRKAILAPTEDGDVEMDAVDLGGDAGGESEADGEVPDDEGWESGTVGDDEKEVDDGWESGSLTREPIDSEQDLDESAEEEGDEPRASRPAPSRKAAANIATSGIQSTFLPSLSVGFVRGGSEDSDWSEREAGAADPDQKKNRRGQRARRAIWEKKYGRNANHKKQEAIATDPSGRPHSRRFDANAIIPRASQRYQDRSAGSRLNKNPPAFFQTRDSGRPQQGNATTMTHATKPTDRRSTRDEGPLHPSWEAKKKMKERQSAGIVASQGKKIKFA